ncbi:MAG TPA: helix-turn-helix domain-containing protein [Gammaproteobacteria bacterium]|nr:helix-turn-helix domain-containing protein [Gammaproteobacteria bacterium]
MSTTAQKLHIIDTPNEDEAKLAAESSRLLAALIGRGDAAQLRLLDGEEEITVPVAAIKMLVDILNQMAKGNAISMVPIHAELTTQQAADFLNVSRPYLVKLLEGEEIPYHKVGVRRKVFFKDLMEYKTKRDEESITALDELTKQAQELNMGY